LTHTGKISHENAVAKAEAEFEHYCVRAALPQPVDEHFDQTLDELKKIEEQGKEPKKPTQKKPRSPRSGEEP